MKIKFNFLDVVILIIIVGVAAGAYMYLNRDGTGGKNDITLEYSVEFTNKDAFMIDKFKVGDNVYVSEKEKAPATIVGVEVKDAEKLSLNSITGEYNKVLIPGYYDILVTLRSMGTETDAAVTASDTPIRVGDELAVKGIGYAGYGFVVDSRIVD